MMSEWFRRLRVLVGRDRFDRDLEQEMRLHQELRARELASNGVSPDDARSAATCCAWCSAKARA